MRVQQVASTCSLHAPSRPFYPLSRDVRRTGALPVHNPKIFGSEILSSSCKLDLRHDSRTGKRGGTALSATLEIERREGGEKEKKLKTRCMADALGSLVAYRLPLVT